MKHSFVVMRDKSKVVYIHEMDMQARDIWDKCAVCLPSQLPLNILVHSWLPQHSDMTPLVCPSKIATRLPLKDDNNIGNKERYRVCQYEFMK